MSMEIDILMMVDSDSCDEVYQMLIKVCGILRTPPSHIKDGRESISKIKIQLLNIFQHPLLMASRMDKWGWELPYTGYFGGVATMSVKQFEQVLKRQPLRDICIDIDYRSTASPTCFGAGGLRTTTCSSGSGGQSNFQLQVFVSWPPRFHGLPIGQLDKEGFYTMTKHAQEPMNQQRVEMLNQGSTRQHFYQLH